MGGGLAAVGDDHVQHHCLTQGTDEAAGRGGGRAAGCFISATGRVEDARLPATTLFHLWILMES